MSPDPVIAVASGKGGTGKTTIAANLALTLSGNGRLVQYIDCDVEEPNGALFLKPDVDNREPVFVPVPGVNLDACTGCGKCGDLCQYGAIVSIDRNVLTFEQLCHSCGGCMQICPAGAITEKQLEIGTIEQGRAGEIDFVQGLLKIGSVRTPSVIEQARKKMNPEGIKIMDAPPGTSCPVIAAVKDVDFVLLVTEPTPFGLHDLKLAVGMVRTLDLPFAVVINRADAGDDRVEEYCSREDIEIVMRLPEDRQIAEAYSNGQMILDALPKYQILFDRLAEVIGL